MLKAETMPQTLTPSDDGAFIIQKITGPIDRLSAMRYNLEAHELGRELGINRFLSDVTESTNSEGETEDFRFANQDMKHEGIDRRARIAFLVAPDDHSHDFIETVTVNAGFNVKLFRNREDAEAFLRK